jgi:ABC-type branched-subunit amino acid transport system substrate-binding protein
MKRLLARFDALLTGEKGLQAVGIAAGVVLITAIASFGANTNSTTSGELTDDGALASSAPGDAAYPTLAPITTYAPGTGPSGGPGTVDGVAGPLASREPLPLIAPIDFGLRTQGITDKEVEVGFSANFSSCGDTAALVQQFGPGLVGDGKKAITAFANYINDTGGIGGRKYKPIFVEDGGSGCPERNAPAAVKMADEEKVFLAVPGLDTESDYIIGRKVPVWGGRDIPDSLRKYGPNGLQLLEPMEPTLDAWASFGKYYLKTDNTNANNACLIRIETGASGNWDIPEKILVEKMAKYGLKFRDIVVFKDDISTAQTQSQTIAAREKAKGCKQAWFMAGNPVGLVFITQAATQNRWFPKWTWTSRTAGSDVDTFGQLMDQQQWENAVGLTVRVPAGQHPKEKNCENIYKKYYPGDGQAKSAAVIVACPAVLTTAEIMRRAIERTGILDANTLLLGADAIRNDFFFDAHVPMEFRFPDADGPFKTRGFSHWTVADWNSQSKKYEFPSYPCYYRKFGPNNAGCEDLRSTFR